MLTIVGTIAFLICCSHVGSQDAGSGAKPTDKAQALPKNLSKIALENRTKAKELNLSLRLVEDKPLRLLFSIANTGKTPLRVYPPVWGNSCWLSIYDVNGRKLPLVNKVAVAWPFVNTGNQGHLLKEGGSVSVWIGYETLLGEFQIPKEFVYVIAHYKVSAEWLANHGMFDLNVVDIELASDPIAVKWSSIKPVDK